MNYEIVEYHGRSWVAHDGRHLPAIPEGARVHIYTVEDNWASESCNTLERWDDTRFAFLHERQAKKDHQINAWRFTQDSGGEEATRQWVDEQNRKVPPRGGRSVARRRPRKLDLSDPPDLTHEEAWAKVDEALAAVREIAPRFTDRETMIGATALVLSNWMSGPLADEAAVAVIKRLEELQ